MGQRTIFVRGEGGHVFELGLPLHETIADKLRKGHLQHVDSDGNVVPTVDNEDQVPGLPDRRPALNAPKGEWVGWAVARGATPDDAEAMSKSDLIEAYGTDHAAGEPLEPAEDDSDEGKHAASE